MKPVKKSVEPAEEATLEMPKKKPEAKESTEKDQEDVEYKLKPLETRDFDMETIETEELVKTKTKKKKKPADDKEKPAKEQEDKPTPDDTDKSIKLGKPKPGDDEPEADIKLRYKQKPEAEEPADQITLRPVKKDKTEQGGDQETEQAISLKLKPKDDEQAVEEKSVKLKTKKKKQKTTTEEAADEVTITKQPEEGPENVTMSLRAPKPDEEDEQEAEFTIKKTLDDVPQSTSEGVKLAKKKKKKTTDEAAAELSISKQAEIDEAQDTQDVITEEQPESEDEAQFKVRRPKKQPEDEEAVEAEAVLRAPKDEEDEVAAEFVIKKKKTPAPVVEEHNDEYTIKKLKKRRSSQVNIPEYSDVEHVTFRPQSTRTKEDVDQEFNITLDAYAEEEISMSGKVKLKKTKPKTYSEAGDEAHIKITEDYDDKSGPIIEEIIDDDDDESVGEDTMNDIDEPDLMDEDIDELPHHVEFKLKPRKSRAYIVEDLDEEFAVGYTHRRKHDVVSFGEDSFTLRTPNRKLPSSYLEEASLFLTQDEIVKQNIFKEENIMHSYCTYIAENAETLNLVEGEKVFVIGMCFGSILWQLSSV